MSNPGADDGGSPSWSEGRLGLQLGRGPPHSMPASSLVLETLLLNELHGLTLEDVGGAPGPAAAAHRYADLLAQLPTQLPGRAAAPELGGVYCPQLGLPELQLTPNDGGLVAAAAAAAAAAAQAHGPGPPYSFEQQTLGGHLSLHLQQPPIGSPTAAHQHQHHQHQLQQQPGLPAGQVAGLGAQPRARRAYTQQEQEKIRRTVYVRGLGRQLEEAQLAAFFLGCGPIVDCRICSDASSTTRFAFIEFREEGGARQALTLSGSLMGPQELQVAPSRTAIVPVKTDFLPSSVLEREAVARTVFVANIDKAVEQEALRDFFSHLCGRVTKLRLLGDSQHKSKIAFLEFESAQDARKALNCSGAVLGNLAIRVSPSKTPVRLDAGKTARGLPTTPRSPQP